MAFFNRGDQLFGAADEKKSNKGWALGLAVLLGVLAAVFAFLIFFTGIFRITELDYDLNPNLKEVDILRLTGVEKGETIIFFKSASSMEKALEKHPYVKAAKVIKHLPNRLELKLTFYEDYACFKHANMYIIVDENGKVLKVMDRAPAKSVPVIEGFGITHFRTGNQLSAKEGDYLEKLLDLVSLVKKSQVASVAGFNLTADGIEMRLDEGLRCNFGSMGSLENQFNNFVVIYEDLKGKGIKAGLIDVNGVGLPTFRSMGN